MKRARFKTQLLCELVKKHPELILMDEEDYAKYKFHRVYVTASNYLVITLNGVQTYFHRLITDTESPMVDHINGLSLDNRKLNLRSCTRSQNNYNVTKSTANKSGFKGVYWNAQTNRWSAKICFDSKVKHLGNYDTAEQAHEAYKNASLIFHKEFSNAG